MYKPVWGRNVPCKDNLIKKDTAVNVMLYVCCNASEMCVVL